jgi:hypothetical protein
MSNDQIAITAIQIGELQMPKKGEKGKYQGGGYPRFQPSQAQRNAVRIMSGVKMAVDEIRQVVLNPLTGLPLTKKAMYRHFRRELEEGPPLLKQLIAEKYMAHLREGREYAVRLGLKNRYGWSTEGAPPPPSVLGIVHDEQPTMRIEFVAPRKAPESESPPPVIDAVPSGPADYSLKAIEPPRPRRRTEFGAVYEQPKGSIFDRPDGKDWMR